MHAVTAVQTLDLLLSDNAATAATAAAAAAAAAPGLCAQQWPLWWECVRWTLQAVLGAAWGPVVPADTPDGTPTELASGACVVQWRGPRSSPAYP